MQVKARTPLSKFKLLFSSTSRMEFKLHCETSGMEVQFAPNGDGGLVSSVNRALPSAPPMQEEILSIVYCEPRSGCLKLLRFILKYGVPVCCGLIIEFKGAESAVSATVLSAWTAYVVICRNLIAHGILDATQWFAAVVFLHVDYLIFCGHLLLRSIRFLSGAACILHFSRCNCCVLWSDAAVSSSR
ncbi:uncharacterized protein LOC116213295 isoform X1 [Punica granatum]|uniref:Uncharacterized protein LOC116213295 isoform X1 n=1 Tax=Punica granatum TaxID=22663 RepID=A0A218WPV4_PUNGR|nr:uncharacterized protein LOC116213295 isoform X1 [Punica granatum]OWM74874.1 hypothetical protein CDL15_Pgr021225 [Punica granatum]